MVDEINQGMDPVNERHIFNLIVQSACNGAQYLLLTPKVRDYDTPLPIVSSHVRTYVRTVLQLLQNLEYSPSVAVHMVNNGQEMITCDKWDLDKMLC